MGNFLNFVIFLVMFLAFTASTVFGQATARMSVNSAWAEGNGASSAPSISSLDGRFIAYESDASNLVSGDTNGVRDVFIYDRQTGIVVLASRGLDGPANGPSHSPAISSIGDLVVFVSTATNLVAGVTSGIAQIYSYSNDWVSLVSLNSAREPGNGASSSPAVEAFGARVAFASLASNLVPADTNGVSDIFVHRYGIFGNPIVERVSVDSSGNQGNRQSYGPVAISPWRGVVFASDATNLVAGDSNGFADIFRRDHTRNITERVSVNSSGLEANGPSSSPFIGYSFDSTLVVFSSLASNLVPADTNGKQDVFLRNTGAGLTTRLSALPSLEGNEASDGAVISDNSRFAAFWSAADNLTPFDLNAKPDIFIRELATGVLERVSDGFVAGGNGAPGRRISITVIGRHIVFSSAADNLVLDDTNQVSDVFLRDRALCADGTVNSGRGPVADMLFVNDEARQLITSVNVPVAVRIEAPGAGPNPGFCIMFIWMALPTHQADLFFGPLLGCTVNPTPKNPFAGPQPILKFLIDIPIRQTPPIAFPEPVTFTLQAVITDFGAGNSTGLSVTNAVTIVVTRPT